MVVVGEGRKVRGGGGGGEESTEGDLGARGKDAGTGVDLGDGGR